MVFIWNGCFNTLFISVSVLLLSVTHSEKVWYEKAPQMEDPCTIQIYGKEMSDMQNAFTDPSCTKGGLIWYKTLGRIHGHFFLSWDRSQEFQVCLTGGLAESVYVWWDSHRDYWQPLGFQNHFSFDDITDRLRCRPSSNGSVDLYFESPWAEVFYLAYVSWELIPLTKDENEAVWEELESTRKGPKPKKDDNANKESSDYLVFLLDCISRNLIYALPLFVVVTFSVLFVRFWYKSRFQKQEQVDNGAAGKKTTITDVKGRTTKGK